MKRIIYAILLLAGLIAPAFGGENFVAADGESVRAEYLQAAERARKDIAIFWTGSTLRGDWWKPCRVTVSSEGDSVGAVGATTFNFGGGEVYNWRMRVQGSRQSIRETVIPHEVSHTIIASVMRRPIARWLDEGMAGLIEVQEKLVLARRNARRYMDHRHCVFQRLDEKEYPEGREGVTALYSTGLTLVEWLVEEKGTSTLWRFANDRRKPSEKFEEFYGVTTSEAWRRWRTWLRDRDVNAPSPLMNRYSRYRAPVQANRESKPTLYVFKRVRTFCRGCYNFSLAYERDTTLQTALQSRYNVVEKDVDDPANRDLVRRYGVQSVPAFCPVNSSRHLEGYDGSTWLVRELDKLPKDVNLEVAPPPPVVEDDTAPPITPRLARPERTPAPTTPETNTTPEPTVTTRTAARCVTGCRCQQCFAQAFNRIAALERRIAELERRPPGRDGADGTNGTNGRDGRGVADVRIHEGNLQFKFTNNSSWVTIGNVTGPEGPQGPAGSGRVVQSARVKNGNLEFRYSDSPDWVAVGPVQGNTGAAGRGVESVRITANGQLEIKYTGSDEWFALGPVRGTADLTEVNRRLTALEPLLRREVRLYIGNRLVDQLTGDEALKPGDPIPIYAIPRSRDDPK